MNVVFDPALDLSISRVIKAPPTAVWRAWTDPASFEQWWVPAPAACRVMEMELHPGGSFVTEIREEGGEFMPHLRGCFLAVDYLQRIVFTTCLLGGWRPAEEPFMTAIITLEEHIEGTNYVARAMHRNNSDRNMHEELGFYNGWGTVVDQLTGLAEQNM